MESTENTDLQETARPAESQLIEKKWKWFYWLFFPLFYLLDKPQEERMHVLKTLLIHPICLFVVFYLIEELIDIRSIRETATLIIIGLYIAGFIAQLIGSIVFFKATKAPFEKLALNHHYVIPLVVFFYLSFGTFLGLFAAFCFVLTLISWAIYSLMPKRTRKLNLKAFLYPTVVINVFIYTSFYLTILLFIFSAS